MPHSAKILLDSINQWGERLTTFEVVYPRIILAEWNTHRVFSRNSASSRAIPVRKVIERVMTDPYIPSSWGKNQKGMQAAEEILGEDALACERSWLRARDYAVQEAQMQMEIGVHKQLANRLLEPFMWHTVVNSSTEWSNFYGLRDDPMAHPDIQKAAALMRELHQMSEPELVRNGEWHTPYATGDEPPETRLQITAGRCARVSLLTQDGEYLPSEDIRLHDTLLSSGHMSPLEHAARPMTTDERIYIFCQPKVYWDRDHKRFMQETNEKGANVFTHFCGNFNGWVQYRKMVRHEEDYGNYLKNNVRR